MSAIDTETVEQEAATAAESAWTPTSLVPPRDLFLPIQEMVSEQILMDSAASPFSESFASLSESELEAQVFDDLVAELEDEEFAEAVEALTNEAAARYMNGVASLRQTSGGPQMAQSEVGQWMEAVLTEAEHILDEIETDYHGQTLEWLTGDHSEFYGSVESLAGPLDAQEFFFKSLRKKFRKVVNVTKNLVKKGIKFVGKLNPLNRIIAALRKAVKPLLRRLLRRAIGKLPRELRPIATRLARRLGVRAEAAEELTEAEVFDYELAEHLLGAEDAFAATTEDESLEAEAAADTTVGDLDAARVRLGQQLADLPDGSSPLSEMEQFIPVVMAAMPLIRLGVKLFGRKRLVNTLAKVLSPLIARLVGRQAARMLSRRLADQGLRMLGLEAEHDLEADTLGPEALVAAAEEAIREIAGLDLESFEDEQLLEAEIQEAFADSAARHMPADVLRPEIVEGVSEGEHGVWMMMPRATAPIYRYKKYSRVIPLRISRPLARSVVMSGGETLERRLDEAGVTVWPAEAEMELYEFLPGATLGHVAAFEDGDGDSDEFEELTEETAAILAGDAQLARRGRYGQPRSPSLHAGSRVFRLRTQGKRLKKRSRFSVRLDLSAARPEIRIHLRLSERDAHRIAQLLQGRQLVQVVAAMRRLVDNGFQKALGARIERTVKRRGIQMSSDAAARLSSGISAAIVRAVSAQLPAAAPQLAEAAKNSAAGTTLTFAFKFADRAAITVGTPDAPKLTIRPGSYRG